MNGWDHDVASRAMGVLALVALLWSAPGWSSNRVALVVGNGGYTAGNLPALANPVNDATLMAEALETGGFEVALVTDADQEAMKAAIEAFGKKLKEGGDAVGLFYYAGHGVEVRGENYLIPIGADIEHEVEFKTDAVPADWVLSWMGAAGNRLNMVVLDACRNNPYEGRSRGASQGLAQMNAPSGTLIAYSAAPGQVALDGEGVNSPYTAALAQAVIEPGLRVEDVFKRVRVAVETETNGEQTPWESSSLTGDFYFVAKAKETPAAHPSQVTVPETVPPELRAQQLAARAYEAAERIHTSASYQLVIEQYPGTLYAELARQQMEKLKGTTTTPVASAEEVESALGLDRSKRRTIQQGLASLGHAPGATDGLFGNRSREAIRRYQGAKGFETTGYLTAEQSQALVALGVEAERKEAPRLVAALQPKCAELPGQYLGEKHAECWEEVANRPKCYLWRTHYHSDQKTQWTGQCRGGVAEGHGTYSVTAGSEHSAYKGTGTLSKGKASGRWIDEWTDGGRYEGQYRDGERNGRGTLTYASGGRYEGDWRDGKRNGRGTLTYANGNRYEGDWRDDKRNGRGTLTYASGGRYEGDWRDGKRNGRGTLTYANGNRYEGDWRDDKRNGRGTIIFANGNRYEGDWRDAKKNGHGTYTFANGARYEGQWRDDKANGRGTIIFIDGERYEGDWRDDKKNGHGTYTFANGDRHEGQYRDNKKNGHGTYVFANGDRYEGQYRDDKRNGRGTLTFAHGTRYEGDWRDERPHGYGTYAFANGARYEGRWRKGCFKGGGQKISVNTSLAACGFE